MSARRLSLPILILAMLAASSRSSDESSTGPAPGDLRAAGTIDFPISSNAAVWPDFERGVALLHSFFYEEARRIFTAVAEKDPNCAMAQWGIAMTWWHPIWTPPTPEEMKLGTAAIDKAMAMIRLRQESVAANRASAEASRAYAKVRQRGATEAEELHAIDYEAYSYLQQGRDDKAKEIVDFAATVRETNPKMEFTAAYALAAIPARYALERNDWKSAAALAIPEVPHWRSFPFMEALIEYAHALGCAHTGDLEGAEKAIARMRQLRDATTDPKFDYFKKHLDLQIKTAAAWVTCVRGKPQDAVAVLRKTAEAEDVLGKHPVSPGALVPIREQLGGLLLEMGQAKDAQREFETELKIYPGRFRGLLGAAQSAEKAEDKESADRYYAKLAAQADKAGASRAELARVRELGRSKN